MPAEVERTGSGAAADSEQLEEGLVALAHLGVFAFKVLGDAEAVQNRQNQGRQGLGAVRILVGERSDRVTDHLPRVALQARSTALQLRVAASRAPDLDVQSGSGLVVLNRFPQCAARRWLAAECRRRCGSLPSACRGSGGT